MMNHLKDFGKRKPYVNLLSEEPSLQQSTGQLADHSKGSDNDGLNRHEHTRKQMVSPGR
jgi:hypothetical protein